MFAARPLWWRAPLEVECAEGIVRRPNFSDEESEQWDQKVSDLRFREHFEYAVVVRA